MPINENWNIRSRSHTCAHSGEPFTDGETFYTALFEEEKGEELVRRDYSLASWEAMKGELKPFSFWKSVYEAPRSEARVEVVEKESAEGLLRRLVEEDSPGTENTRYILAIMLERKKILKHTATRETEDANFLIYEHPKTGEVYLIRDPELRLDQVEAVQREVTLLLTHGQRQQVADEPTGEPAAAAEETVATETTTSAAEEAAPAEEAEPEATAEPAPTEEEAPAEEEAEVEPAAESVPAAEEAEEANDDAEAPPASGEAEEADEETPLEEEEPMELVMNIEEDPEPPAVAKDGD